MAIKDWSITIFDLTWVTEDNNLSDKGISFSGWFIIKVRSNKTSFDIFNRETFNIETNIITWNSLWHLSVMHFDGFNFSSESWWGEFNSHTWFDDTSFDSSDWYCTDTRDFVDILEWESKWGINWSFWSFKFIEGLKKGQSFEPFHVVWWFHHVITDPSWDWDELNLFLNFVTSFWKEFSTVSTNFFESFLTVVDSLFVHLVDTDDHLFDTECESEESVFSGLSVFRNTSFEFSSWRSDHKKSAISLRSTSNHVFDEISVTWSVNDSEHVFLGGEFPERNINSDTSFSFRFKLI